VTATPIRISLVVLDILAAIERTPDDPPWGLRLCCETCYGSGTVYPALDKLLKAGWITDRWEETQPADRPRRRFYMLTDDGREALRQALAARAARRSALRAGR
jgi:PadR family transcriptional regulator